MTSPSKLEVCGRWVVSAVCLSWGKHPGFLLMVNEALWKQLVRSRTENTVCIAVEEELGAMYQPRAN